jgi:Domain of unknown function (DUF2017)
VKVSRRHGRVRLRLEAVEVRLLTALLDELETVLSGPPGSIDPVRERLTPAAYPDDAAAEAEYRDITADSLLDDRTERIAACRAELAQGGDIDLAAEDAGRRWIQVLNDLRLSLGTRLGIAEDDDPRIEPTDPEAAPRTVYYWLTAVQDEVVHALMR